MLPADPVAKTPLSSAPVMPGTPKGSRLSSQPSCGSSRTAPRYDFVTDPDRQPAVRPSRFRREGHRKGRIRPGAHPLDPAGHLQQILLPAERGGEHDADRQAAGIAAEGY